MLLLCLIWVPLDISGTYTLLTVRLAISRKLVSRASAQKCLSMKSKATNKTKCQERYIVTVQFHKQTHYATLYRHVSIHLIVVNASDVKTMQHRDAEKIHCWTFLFITWWREGLQFPQHTDTTRSRSSQRLQTGCGAHPAAYPSGHRGKFPLG
jgi:hypothetical protein